jgi:hypothetical protein
MMDEQVSRLVQEYGKSLLRVEELEKKLSQTHDNEIEASRIERDRLAKDLKENARMLEELKTQDSKRESLLNELKENILKIEKEKHSLQAHIDNCPSSEDVELLKKEIARLRQKLSENTQARAKDDMERIATMDAFVTSLKKRKPDNKKSLCKLVFDFLRDYGADGVDELPEWCEEKNHEGKKNDNGEQNEKSDIDPDDEDEIIERIVQAVKEKFSTEEAKEEGYEEQEEKHEGADEDFLLWLTDKITEHIQRKDEEDEGDSILQEKEDTEEEDTMVEIHHNNKKKEEDLEKKESQTKVEKQNRPFSRLFARFASRSN